MPCGLQLNALTFLERLMNTLHIRSARMSSVGKRHKGMAGFALIEVMIAVLLFAIGILGLVGLQASMTQAQSESKVRADAANLIDELATVMWGELGQQAQIALLADFSTAGCSGNTACNAWLTKLGKTLPGGTLTSLAFNDVADTWDINHGMVTVTLSWALPNGSPHQYVATFNVAQNAVVAP
jgi:type IV pilus assembly protein PilV